MSTTSRTASHALHNANSPPLPKNVQWDLLESKLDTVCVSAPLLAAPRWLELVDRAVLLTLMSKLRSELNLLRSEAKLRVQSGHTTSGVSLPNHDIETRKPDYPAGAPAPLLPVPISRARLLSRRTRTVDESRHGTPTILDTKGTRHTDEGDTRHAPLETLSPLSPSFGPRKGLVPSGTVERRRSVPFTGQSTSGDSPAKQASRDAPPHSASFAESSRSAPCKTQGSSAEERRILWEDTCTEPEQNIGVYADRFEDVKGAGGDANKAELWTELVALLKEKRAMSG